MRAAEAGLVPAVNGSAHQTGRAGRLTVWDLVVARAAARSAARRYGRLCARRAPETEVFVARIEALRTSERAAAVGTALGEAS